MTSARTSDGDDEREVPPAVLCASCGRIDCAGCAHSASDACAEPILAWEGSGSVAQRLFRTAQRTSNEPGRTFGALPEGTLGSALRFALLAETLAIGSFGLVFVALALGIAPRLSWRVLSHPIGIAYVLSGIAAASSIMVALHVVWGACLELFAGATTGLKQSLRFGLYACGWDLLTSPVGVIATFRSEGAHRTLTAVANAIRAPGPALRAYQEDLRQFEPTARQRALRLSMVVLGATLCVLLPLGGYVLFGFVEWVLAL